MKPTRGKGKGASANIGYSQALLDEEDIRDDAEKALQQMLSSGEYKELLQSMKNDPELAGEMETSLAASGMSWEDLAGSLDLMAEGKGPMPGGKRMPPSASSSSSSKTSSSSTPSLASSSKPTGGPTSNKTTTSAAKPNAPPPNTIVVTPQPAFVVKSVNQIATQKYPEGIKVFINFCHSPEMFQPPPLGSVPIQKILNQETDFEYRVPIAVGQPRAGLDKAGKACIEVDACLHSSVIEIAERDLDYQEFLVELVMENVEDQLDVALGRDFSLPKMKAKGVLGKIVVSPPAGDKGPKPAVAKVATTAKGPVPSAAGSAPTPSGTCPKIVELQEENPKEAEGKSTPNGAPLKSILKQPAAASSPKEKEPEPNPPKPAVPVAPAVVERTPPKPPVPVAPAVVERTPPKPAVPVAPAVVERAPPPKLAIQEVVKERAAPPPTTSAPSAAPKTAAPSKPLITEVSGTTDSSPKPAATAKKTAPSVTEPKHSVRVLGSAPGRKLEIEIVLPGMTTMADAALDVSVETITLDIPTKYHLDIKLPFKVNYVDEALGRAVFERSKKLLHVHLEEAECVNK